MVKRYLSGRPRDRRSRAARGSVFGLLLAIGHRPPSGHSTRKARARAILNSRLSACDLRTYLGTMTVAAVEFPRVEPRNTMGRSTALGYTPFICMLLGYHNFYHCAALIHFSFSLSLVFSSFLPFVSSRLCVGTVGVHTVDYVDCGLDFHF